MEDGKQKKRIIDWEAIRQEWDVGQLDLREIARQHGITHQAILNRAKRKGWSPRPEKSAIVTDIVTKHTQEAVPTTVTNPRIALTAFQRAIQLLTHHRKLMGMLRAELERCLADVAELRQRRAERNQPFRLHEIDTILTSLAKAAQALAKLIPLERRAFGFDDSQAPSEFDALTEAQLDAVEQTIRKALE